MPDIQKIHENIEKVIENAIDRIIQTLNKPKTKTD